MCIFVVIINHFNNLLKPHSPLIKYILFVILSLLLCFGVYKCVFPNKNEWNYVSALGTKAPLIYTMHGIDVSHHNGKINWQKVSEIRFNDDKKIEFAFIKASEGRTLDDKSFEKNWINAKKEGVCRGAYHYYIPWLDPEPQANLFIRKVTLKPGDLAPVLDIEENSKRPDKKIIADIGTWLRLIENHYGIKPIIYTNHSFYKKFIEGHYDNYPLWIADYSSQNLRKYTKNTPVMWQYSKSGNIEGIEEEVDLNVYLKANSSFQKLIKN